MSNKPNELFIPLEKSSRYKNIVDIFSKLKKSVDKITIERNKIKLNDFYRYEVLFNKDKIKEIDQEQLTTITDEFYKLIDPYYPIYIIDDNDKVLFTLPAFFLPTNKIKLDDNNLSTLEKMKSSNKGSLGDDTIAEYALLYFKSQLTDTHKKIIKQYKSNYKDCVDQLNNLNNNNIKKDNNEIQSKNNSSRINIEDEGIQWD